jgi:hypothetical protein
VGKECCCVVDQFCTAPCNIDPPMYAKGVCFCCGQAVCRKCSTKRKYFEYGKQRLCNDCQIDYDGHDKVVMRRLYKLAGY